MGNLQCFPKCPHGENSLPNLGITCGSHVEARLTSFSSATEGTNQMKFENIKAYARFRTREMKTHKYRENSKCSSHSSSSKINNNPDVGNERKKRKKMSKDKEVFHIASSELENKLFSKIGSECSKEYLDHFVNTNKTDGRLGELYEGSPTLVNGNETIFKFSPQQRSTWQLSKYKGSRYMAALHSLHIVFFEVIDSQNSSSNENESEEQSKTRIKMKFIYEIESEEFLILGHRKKVLWENTSKEIQPERMIIDPELRRKMLITCRESKIFPETLVNQQCSCKITKGKELPGNDNASLYENDSSEIHLMQVLETPSVDLTPQKQMMSDRDRSIFEGTAQKRGEIEDMPILDEDERLFLVQQSSNNEIENSDDLFKLWADSPITKDM